MEFLRRLFGLNRESGSPPARHLENQTDLYENLEPAVVPYTPPPDEDETLQTRPLAPPRPFKNTRQHLRVGQATDPGQVRSNNQDACLSFIAMPDVTDSPAPIGFFVVADGMGGHDNGEIASTLAVQTLAKHVLSEVIVPHLSGAGPGRRTISEVLNEAMSAANRAVQKRISDGGTTATCAVVRGDEAHLAHVGDSRAYLIADGTMELITRDHSLVRRLQELGQLTAEEAEVHPQRNVLYRAIGQGESLEIDTVTRRLPPSSRLLLCSDGMWGVVGEQRMMAILEEYDDPQEACDRLINEANASGGPDNITIVLVQMPD